MRDIHAYWTHYWQTDVGASIEYTIGKRACVIEFDVLIGKTDACRLM